LISSQTNVTITALALTGEAKGGGARVHPTANALRWCHFLRQLKARKSTGLRGVFSKRMYSLVINNFLKPIPINEIPY